MAVISADDVRDYPQICGDALKIALDSQAPGAAALAGACVAVLDDRGWEGDAELAAQLRRAMGQATTNELTPVPVDLEQLVDLLRGGEHHLGGRLNIRTGEAWPEIAGSDLDDVLDTDESGDEATNADDWVYIDALGPRRAYRDMEDFIADHVPAELGAPLRATITGKGAFSRFRLALRRWPDLEDRWYRYSEECWAGRARAWLAEAGYVAGPPFHPTP